MLDYKEEEGGEGDEYEYFEVEEESEEARKAYVKRMIKDSKEQDGQFKRPDYKPGSSPKELDDKEYESPVTEEPEKEQQKPKVEEKKKEEYEL